MKKLIFGTCVCVLIATTSLAQINNATLTGTVGDATGAVLPGVTITATNNATGVVTTAVSNEAGAFNVFNHPQPGNPNLSINPSSLTTGAALPWGQILNKTGNRTLQAQLRFMF